MSRPNDKVLAVRCLYGCALLLALVAGLDTTRELLSAPRFESVSQDPVWYCNCQLQVSTDCHSGLRSVKVTNRRNATDGLAQKVSVVPGVRYKLTGYIKLLSVAPGALYQTVALLLSCDGATGPQSNVSFGEVPMIQKATGWAEIGGIAIIPNGAHNCTARVQVNDAAVDYLIDDVSLKEVVVPDDWKTFSNANIEIIRKANITIRVTGPASLSGLELELNQTKSQFPFGSAVGASEIVDPAFARYQEVFYDNFEWAVLENALKWRALELKKGPVNYSKPLTAIRSLLSKGVPVRGHNVFWGPWYMVQPWLWGLPRDQLLATMHNHTEDVIGHTKGMLAHWDVNNENLHGDWYETATGNANITMEMFKHVHAIDNDTKLFLNDFGILGRAERAMALKDQAKLFKAAGVPIHGIGIQSHLPAPIDVKLVKARLDLVAEAGLPIWITELTVLDKDVNRKAAAINDLLTLYYGHPAVEGVMLWGFWDKKMYKKDWALFEGPNVTANAAGREYQTLVKKTWRTQETHQISVGQTLDIRAFKGDYTVAIKRQGQTLKSEHVTLGDDGLTLNIQLATSGGRPSAAVIIGR